MKTMKLRCDLTEDELGHRRENLLGELDEIDKVTDDKKEAAKKFADKIKAGTNRAVKLRTVLRQGYELREVAITEKREKKSKEMLVVRDDTGEVVTRRPLTMAELQTTLVGIDGGKGGKSKDDAKAGGKDAKASKKAPSKKAPAKKARSRGGSWDAAEAATKGATEE